MMDRESIRQTPCWPTSKTTSGEPIASLDDEVAIREGLGLDSVDVVGLVMQVERQFRIRLATEELTEIATVGDMLDLLQAKIAANEVAEPASRDAA